MRVLRSNLIGKVLRSFFTVTVIIYNNGYGKTTNPKANRNCQNVLNLQKIYVIIIIYNHLLVFYRYVGR